jgi:pilus assembly protein CpaE
MAYCKNEQRALLVDLNLTGGDLAVLLRLQPTHSIADFCQHSNRMDESMFENCLVKHTNGLALLAAPQRHQDVAKITARGVRKAITMARSHFPYVIVDVDRSYRSEHTQALFQSDVILLVVRLDIPSIRQAGRLLAFFDDLGVARERIRLVVNRVTPSTGIRDRDVEAALRTPVAISLPAEAKNLSRAAQVGVPLLVERPRSYMARGLTELARSLNGNT